MAMQQQTITTTQNQPLIGIPFKENGREVVRYFAEETQADQAFRTHETTDALTLAGQPRHLTPYEALPLGYHSPRRIFA